MLCCMAYFSLSQSVHISAYTGIAVAEQQLRNCPVVICGNVDIIQHCMSGDLQYFE